MLGPFQPRWPVPANHAVVQRTVLDDARLALLVVCDGDGDVAVFDGLQDPPPGDLGLYVITPLADLEHVIGDLPKLLPGYAASRTAPGAPWVVEPYEYDKARA